MVSYTSRVDFSTEKLLKFFLEESKHKTKIDFLDLAKEAPDLLIKENLNLMVKRNIGGIITNMWCTSF